MIDYTAKQEFVYYYYYYHYYFTFILANELLVGVLLVSPGLKK